MSRFDWESLVMLVLTLSGCLSGVVRDEATYRAEVGFMEAAALQEAESLVLLIKANCKCDTDGTFMSPDCEKAAKRALVVKARVPWHTAMSLYNARLSAVKPADAPPDVPLTKTLCPPTPALQP